MCAAVWAVADRTALKTPTRNGREPSSPHPGKPGGKDYAKPHGSVRM